MGAEAITDYFKLIEERRKPLCAKGALPREERQNLRRRLRQLERARRRVKNAEREEHVYLRLQRALR